MKFQLTFSIWSKSPTSKRRSIYPEEEGNKSINLAEMVVGRYLSINQQVSGGGSRKTPVLLLCHISASLKAVVTRPRPDGSSF